MSGFVLAIDQGTTSSRRGCSTVSATRRETTIAT